MARLYSIVYAFNGAGALVGALGIVGLLRHHQARPSHPFLALLAFSTLIIGFPFAPTIPIMAACSMLAGAAYMATSSLRHDVHGVAAVPGRACAGA